MTMPFLRTRRNRIAFWLFRFIECPFLLLIGYAGGERLPRWLPSLLIRDLDA